MREPQHQAHTPQRPCQGDLAQSTWLFLPGKMGTLWGKCLCAARPLGSGKFLACSLELLQSPRPELAEDGPVRPEDRAARANLAAGFSRLLSAGRT